MYFETLFGSRASKGLTILPILSAASNMIAVFIGHSRMVREIGRQGVLPWPRFWVSTRPFGTPAGSQIFMWFISVLMVIIPPAGNAFNFIVSLSNYPSSFFLMLMTFGLFLIRRQRKKLGLPRPEYRGWTVVAVFFLLVNLFLIVMPWVPPKAGLNASSFNFFYAASSLTGVGFIALCGLYYVFWTILLPKWGKYKIRHTVLILEDGSVGHKLVKVPLAEVEAWDAKHDPTGRSIDESGESSIDRHGSLDVEEKVGHPEDDRSHAVL